MGNCPIIDSNLAEGLCGPIYRRGCGRGSLFSTECALSEDLVRLGTPGIFGFFVPVHPGLDLSFHLPGRDGFRASEGQVPSDIKTVAVFGGWKGSSVRLTLAGSLPWLRHPVFLLFSPKWSFRIEDEEKFREAMNVRGIETHSVKSLQWMVWAGLVLFVTSGMIDRIVEAWPSVSWALLFAGAGILWALRLGNAKLRIRKRPVNRVLRRLDWLIGACVLLSIGLFSASDRLWSKTDEHAAKARRLWKAHLEKEAIEPDEVIGAHLERKPSVSAYMETLACAEFGLGHQEQALHTAAGAYR